MGLSKDHDQSYAYFMRHNLFDHVNIDQANCNIPSGLTNDPEAECTAYDKKIAALGGTDLQLLGMGPNGHIGFNEPDETFTPGTHCVKLADSTIDANAIKAAVTGPIDPKVPASILQLHPDCTIVADEEALSLL